MEEGKGGETQAPAPPAGRQELACPECGKVYKYPQGLGNHRRTAHGIAGTHPSSRAGRKKRSATPGRKPRMPLEVVDDLGLKEIEAVFTEACLYMAETQKGMRKLREATKALRLELIKSRKELLTARGGGRGS